MKLVELAAELAGRGHRPLLALAVPNGAPLGLETFQAPLWPSQLTQLARPTTTAPATMGDILVAVGIAEPGALQALLRGWDAILGAVRPAAIVAEYAPALGLAARGRVPVLGLGTGFSMPPPQLPRFASLTGAPPFHDEARLLDLVNAQLRALGRASLPSLPELFRTDRALASVFRELDPYRDLRVEPHGIPSTSPTAMSATPGDEIFVYLSGGRSYTPALWHALGAAGLPVRLHDPRRTPADLAELERWGIATEPQPVPFAKIARRSRLIVSHGSLGFATAGLIAGLPQVLIPSDIEKALIAGALVELGVARAPAEGDTTVEAVVALIADAYRDAAMLDRARSLASGFAARLTTTAAAEAADAVESLL